MSFESSFLEDDMSCRICKDTTKKDLCSPCGCTGSMLYVHTSCIQKWVDTTGKTTCEVCHSPYVMPAPPSRPYFFWMYGIHIILVAIVLCLDWTTHHALLHFSAPFRSQYILDGFPSAGCIYLYTMAMNVIPVHVIFGMGFGAVNVKISKLPMIVVLGSLLMWAVIVSFCLMVIDSYFYIINPLVFLINHYFCFRLKEHRSFL